MIVYSIVMLLWGAGILVLSRILGEVRVSVRVQSETGNFSNINQAVELQERIVKSQSDRGNKNSVPNWVCIPLNDIAYLISLTHVIIDLIMLAAWLTFELKHYNKLSRSVSRELWINLD